MNWFKRKKKEITITFVPPKDSTIVKYTIEDIEKMIGENLTYPIQYVDDMSNPKYDTLQKFGCSDIMDKKGSWLHRDCFAGQLKGYCEKCNFYPLVKEYHEKKGTEPNASIADLFKADFLLDGLKDLESPDEKIHEGKEKLNVKKRTNAPRPKVKWAGTNPKAKPKE